MEIYGLHDKEFKILKKFSVLQTNINNQMKSEKQCMNKMRISSKR